MQIPTCGLSVKKTDSSSEGPLACVRRTEGHNVAVTSPLDDPARNSYTKSRSAGDARQSLWRGEMDDCALAQPFDTAINNLESDMRIGRGHRLWLACWFLAGAGIALVADPGHAQRFEYVITFNNIVVQGIEGAVDTPEVTLRDYRSERPAGQFPKVLSRHADSLLPFAPAEGTDNPSFVQEGFLVEAFWAVKTGTAEGFFKRAHFHPGNLASGFEAQHLGHPNELHGIFIRSLDGKRFGLKKLRYRVTSNRALPNKPLSIEGFSNFSVNVLVARSFDPRGPIRAQFVSFPVGLPAGNDPKLPWSTLWIFGFELVDHVYIASSASVDLDDIVLTRIEPPPAVEEQREEDK